MDTVSKSKEKNNILTAGSKNLNNENWKVFHPNGKHMFTCGERKASWYLDRELAKKIGKKSIELTFTPKGNGFDDNEDFGRGIRENICVVDGTSGGLQRHHIVPYCYRSYFPEKYKTKNHHDVVLIDHVLHSKYEQQANKHKNVIAKKYNVKTINQLNGEYSLKLREYGKEGSLILSTLHSIFKSYGSIPNERKLEKIKTISELTKIPFNTLIKLNYIQLYKLYLLIDNEFKVSISEFKKENQKLFDHGYHVVQKLDTEEKIREFVKLWRVHFIETMKPKHMPFGWSIDFRIKTKI